jgi:hypothetical protein
MGRQIPGELEAEGGVDMNAQGRTSAAATVTKVRDQFEELTGQAPVSISGLSRVDGGWQLMVEVVELRRVPDTASLLATYRVITDEAGDVEGYERVRRYNRGEAD